MARKKDPKKEPLDGIIEATLALAAEGPWADVDLAAIAARAGIGLDELHRHVRDRNDILETFMARTDRAVLAGIDPKSSEEVPRDILMMRFEHLEPHKPAIRSIASGLRGDPLDALSLAGPASRSCEWMMAGAGIEAEGGRRALRTKGLAFVWLSVMRVWLEDDDPGLARTMAALDRQLRNGETWLRNAEIPAGIARMAGTAISEFCRRLRERRAEAADGSQPDAEPAP